MATSSVRSLAALAAVASAAPLCLLQAAGATTQGARQRVLAVVDLGTRPSAEDLVTLSLQHSPSPIVSVRVAFFGATASLRGQDAGRRLGTAGVGQFSGDLRAPAKPARNDVAVLLRDDHVRITLKLGTAPELHIRTLGATDTAEVKPGYSGVNLSFTTSAGRFDLAPKRGCEKSGARLDAILQDGSRITKTTWISCP